MDKRSDLRKFYQSKEQAAQEVKQFQQRTAQLNALKGTVIDAFNALIRFMDGKTTKTEVVNQLKSISTPDVDKVVQAVSKLDADVLGNKVDTKPIVEALNSLKREITILPAKMPKSEKPVDAVTVTNLDQVTFDTTDLEKAIKDLKLDPKIEVKSPEVNVEAPDLSPLKTVMLDVLKAIKDQEYPESPTTDLSTLEKEAKSHTKQLEEANKHLKKIVEKPVGGGGGGGGNGTPYTDETGKPVYVELVDGAVPTTGARITERYDYNDSTTIYTAFAPIGTLDASIGWTITKYDLTDTNDASGKVATDVSWTNRTTGSYA
jgi:hypothetical protein